MSSEKYMLSTIIVFIGCFVGNLVGFYDNIFPIFIICQIIMTIMVFNIFQNTITLEQFESFVIVNNYKRFMDLSGQYDDDKDDIEQNRKWERELESHRQNIPKKYKPLLGNFRDEEEALKHFTIKG